MIDLIDLAIEIQKNLERKKWDFVFIGGLAVQHWGEPRMTQDIDLSLFTNYKNEDKIIAELLKLYKARIKNADTFARLNRVLLLKSKNGIGIDIALAGLPFEKDIIDRAIMVKFAPNKSLKICSSEDLIIMKTFAFRPQDQRDVQSVIARQGKKNLDWKYIYKQLAPLAEVQENDIQTWLKNVQKTRN